MLNKPNFDSYEENFRKYRAEVSGFTFNDEIKINFLQRDLHTEVVTVPQDLLRASRELFTGEQLVYDARDLYSTPFVEISQGFTSNGTPQWSQGDWEDKKDPQLRHLNYVSDKVGMFKQPAVMEIDKNVILAKNLPNAPPRSGLFSTIPVDRIPKLQEPSLSARPSFEERGIKLMFEVKELKFDSGNVEPFQLGFFIFDCETQVKLSETFTMSTSPEFTAAGDPKAFIVRIQQLRPTVCLGITIFHRFSEDYDDAINPYLKTPTGKHFTKWESTLKEVTTNHLQYFAYAVHPLFTKDGATLFNGDFTVEPIIKVKDDFYTFADKYILEGEKERSKLKTIPGRLKMYLRNVTTEDLTGKYTILNPSLYPVTQPRGPAPAVSAAPVVRELQQFYVSEDVVAPYTEYVNTLYIYPESINLTNYKGADCGAKNVLAGFKILSSDNSATEKGLRTCYPFKPNHGLTEEVFLPVQYHQKKLKFLLAEELKFEIPSALTKSHNLVITLYNIDLKKKKAKGPGDDGSPDVLGHCIMPLIKDEWMATDGKYSIPMLYLPPQRYLAGLDTTDNKEYKWIDGRKLTFNFRLKLVSSVYPSDPAISRFLRLNLKDLARSKPLGINDPDSKLTPDQKMEKLIHKLRAANGYLLTMHFQMITNKLLSLAREDSSSLGRTSFRELLNILDKVSKDVARKLYVQPVLESYVDFMYTPPHSLEGAKTISEAVLCGIAEAMNPTSTVAALREMAPLVAEYAWFLYGVAYRDMILTLYNRKLLIRGGKRSVRFSEVLINFIRKGVEGMAAFVAAQSDPRVCYEGNNATALFLRNLLNIVDRGVVFNLIYSYVETLNAGSAASSSGASYDGVQTCKFNFLRIIMAHEQYVQLLMPKSDKLESIETFDIMMFQDHFLSQLLIRETRAALTRKGATHSRQMALAVVLEILHKHELDPTLEMPICKSLVMNAYFPLVIALNNTLPDIFPLDEQITTTTTTTTTTISATPKTIVPSTSPSLPGDVRSGHSPTPSSSSSSSLPAAATAAASGNRGMPLKKPSLEYKMWLVCMLEIVKHTGDLMRCWLPKEKPRNIANFFRQLSRAAEFFDYPGKDLCKPYSCDFLNAVTATALSSLKTPVSSGAMGGALAGSGTLSVRRANSPGIAGQAGGVPAAAGGGGAGASGGQYDPTDDGQTMMLENRVLSRKEVRSVILGRSTTMRTQNVIVNNGSASGSGSDGGSGSGSGGSSGDSAGDAGSGAGGAVVFAPELLERAKTIGMSSIIPSTELLKERWSWTFKSKGDSAKRDFVAMAKNGLMEVSHITLNCCLDYLNDCFDLMTQPQQQHVGDLSEIGETTLPAAIGVIGSLLKCEQCEEFMPLLIFAASLTIKRYRVTLFTRCASVCKELTYDVLRLLESPCPQFRQMALGILCGMLACNQVVAKNISLMKLQCTIVLSQLVGDKAKFLYTEEGFKAIAMYFGRSQFANETNDLYSKVREIVQNAAVLEQYSNDREVIGSLYYGLSNGFLDSPDLRLAWLDNLAKLHLENENREECAKTKTLMAALALKYSNIVKPAKFRVVIPDSAWESVLPNFPAQSKMPNEKTLLDLKGEICTSRYFTTKGFESLLLEAIEDLHAISNYEQCIETRRLLLLLYMTMHDYSNQSATYLDLYHLCQKTADEIKLSTRVPPNYYRVAFYGPSFGEKVNGKQFIYKEPPFVRIADFTERIKKQFEKKGIVPEILPNSKEVVPGLLATSKNYLQIGAVSIVESDDKKDIDEALSRNEISQFEAKKLRKKLEKTLFEKHFGVNTFFMEMPFIKGSGKAQGDIQDQWKRRITFVTEGAFPSVEKRALIVSQRAEEIPPVENAIALIRDKIHALEVELSSAKPDTRTLQIVLNGSLLAFVNAGPLEICKVFLGQDRLKLSPVPSNEQIAKLKEAMKKFSKSLSFALKLNKRLIKQEQEELQKELELAYDDFSKKINDYCA